MLQTEVAVNTGLDQLSKKSLKQQVKGWLSQQIRIGRMKPGDKLPTERALATTLGVSRKTVEMAMRELEAEDVIFRRVGRGTFLRDSSRAMRAGLRAGNVLAYVPNIANPHFAVLVSYLERAFREQGVFLTIVQHHSLADREAGILAALRRTELCGVVGLGLPAMLLDFARKQKLPCVNIGHVPESDSAQIFIDIGAAGRLVADYLLAAGHRKVVCAGAIPGRGESRLDPKFRAIAEKYRDAGVGFDLDRQVVPHPLEPGDAPDYETIGKKLVTRILRRSEKPTAIVFFNDARALGGMKALIRKGYRIPDDVSVIGFDDIPMAGMFCPALTTVRFDLRRIAREVVAMLKAGAKPATVRIEPKLVVRESSSRLAR